MTSIRAGRLLGGAALLAAGFTATAAGAQTSNVVYPAGAVVQSLETGTATKLADFVRALAIDPRNLASLLGAGNAALELGDTTAALGFFARAEEVAPRDGRVKAGMGSVFVHTEQPQAALKFFQDAAAAGAPISLYVKDRGLAYDMIGDTARAQADYQTALRFGHDPEVERRLALSKAISGDKAGALALLAPQLQRQDRAAWRANAFVLALTGDVDGAVNAVRTALPAQAMAMRPFLARLAQLGPADKAMAVHFGTLPINAHYAAASPAPSASTPLTAGRPDVRQPALGAAASLKTAEAAPPQTRRPSNFDLAGRGRVSSTTASRPAAPAAVPARAPAAAAQQPAPVAVAPAATTPAQFQPVATATLTPSAAASGPLAVSTEATPAPTPAVQTSAGSTPAQADGLDFADVAAAIATLADAPVAEEPRAPAPKPKSETPKPAPAKAAASKPAEDKKPVASKKPAAEKKAAAPKEPSRIWVQLAASQNKAAFPAEFKRLKAKAPDLFKGKSAWTAPSRASNRLLVGPFETDKEAREFVNGLSKASIESFSWKSEAGQAVEKLPAK